MKVVIAIDSLKGSLSSIEAGMAIREGVLRAKPDAEVIVKPLADGGEGTTDALIEGMNGERIDLTVTGPMHTPVKAHYGYLKDSNTAVMEMASAAGITLVPDDAKDPLLATSYGVGEMINHAFQKGCRNFIIGIGGSATNDGGIGMLKALGVRFLDENDVDAILTSQLLINIFEKNTPLHDGAVIVRGNRVVSATCYLPLSDSLSLSKDLGTRHRAAVGVSEVSDSLTIIVSEETGSVSTAYKGQIEHDIDADHLRTQLKLLQNRHREPGKFELIKRRFKNGKEASKNLHK